MEIISRFIDLTSDKLKNEKVSKTVGGKEFTEV